MFKIWKVVLNGVVKPELTAEVASKQFARWLAKDVSREGNCVGLVTQNGETVWHSPF